MSETRGTMKHAAVYSAAAMLGRMAGFLMLPFYAHMLQANGYGIISLLDVGLTFLATMGGTSSYLAIMRNYHDETDPAEKMKVISTGFYLVTFGSVVLTLPFIIFAKPLAASFLDGPEQGRLIILSMLTFIANMSGQAATTWLVIRQRSMLYGAINLVRLFVSLSLNIWLIVVREMGLDGYFLSGLISAALFSIVYIWIIFHDCGRAYSKDIARRIRDFLFPLVPGNLVRFVSRQFEKVFVRFRIDMNSVGILEMAYRFPILISMLIVNPFMSAWDTKRFEIADQPGAPVVIGRMYTWFLFLMTFGGLILAVNIDLILQVLTPPEFHLAHRIARIEIVTLILQGSTAHMVFGLLYAKQTGLISKINAVVAVGKVGLAWFLISHFGIYGAAFSAAVAEMANLLVSFFLARRRYRMVLEWPKIWVMAGLSVGIFVALVRWDVSGFPLFVYVRDDLLVRIHDVASGTFLAKWKGGKLPAMLLAEAGPVAELMLKIPLSASFGLLLPFIHRESRLKMAATLRSGMARFSR